MIPDIAGRVVPHDLGAEAAVLSAAMLSSDALDQVADSLKPEHFYSTANAAVYAACVDLLAAGSAVDVVTVAAHLRAADKLQAAGGPTYLAQLVDSTPAVAHVADHAQVIIDTARVRRLIATCQRIAAEGYGDVGDRARFIDQAEQDIHAIAHSDTQDDGRHIRGVLTDMAQRLAEAAERGETVAGIPTGFRDLDKMVGGLGPGDLVIVAARPSMGKTALALNIAVSLARRTVRSGSETVRAGVGVFSLEMPGEQVGIRMACSEGGVDVGRLRRGEMTDVDWSNLTAASAELSDLPIWVDDKSGLTSLELRAHVRRLRARMSRWPQRTELSAVLIDYLQLMGARRVAGRSRENEVSEQSRDLKNLAKELGLPLVVLSQLNRACETRNMKDKRPMLSDLRESGSLEQDADVVLFIYRDEYYNPDTTDRGLAEIIIAKQRNGPPGKVMLRWYSAATRFQDLARDEYQHHRDPPTATA